LGLVAAACSTGALPASTSTGATIAVTTSAPEAVPLQVDGPGRYEADLVSGGLVRRFVLFVPESAPDPAPLVIAFHGFTRDPEYMEALSGFSELAEAEGFVVAYPEGTGFPRRWMALYSQGNQDVAFTRDLVAAIAAVVPIDPRRVYAAGFSSGGAMAARLGCDAADLIAAVGPVAAPYPAMSACAPSRAVPLAAFHGRDDAVVPFDPPPGTGTGVEENLGRWAERNGCAPGPEEHPVAAEVTRLAWEGCAAGADVVLYAVTGGRHGWPGSADSSFWGLTTDAVDASAMLWEFFAAHPMP